jgi:hypothetical protein
MDIIMERVTIGSNYKQQLTWKKAVGIPLVHLPLMATMPENNIRKTDRNRKT